LAKTAALDKGHVDEKEEENKRIQKEKQNAQMALIKEKARLDIE
jgi:hypothetical protein